MASHFPLKDTDPQREDAADGVENGNQDIPMQKASKHPYVPLDHSVVRKKGLW